MKTQTTWQIRIEDPSGETRSIPLGTKQYAGALQLGRSETAQISLRDPTVLPLTATLWPTSQENPGISPYWIRTEPGSPPILMGDLSIREAQLPSGVPLRIGESRLTLEPRAQESCLPEFPGGVRPWLTVSESGRALLWNAKKAAATPLSLYIAGETGTGKEVIAQLLHAWSDRAAGPFIPLHCAALPVALAESELFGHVKGAFTGAIQQRPGALMQAHNGTLFLDEVGDLPLDIQVKLLRFLENGEIRPVGADRSSHADARLLCATHLPLEKLVEEGRFRRDLYYRLASVTLEIPTLRSRPEDIELLGRRFASDLERHLTPRALLRLKAHAWPGNVRELRHAIERASALAGPFVPTLQEQAFDFLLTPAHVTAQPQLELGVPVLSLHEMERLMVLKALRLAYGNRARAAKILGVARSTLFEMIKRHNILGPRGTQLAFL